MVADANDQEKKIDYVLKLQPSKKQYFSIDLEGSSILNTSQLVQVGSGRVGIANNFTLRNRNIGKRGIQLENSLRTGVEFNNFKKLLSGEITLTNRLTFPRMVAPFNDKFKSRFQQAKTVISADVSYIDRFRFFRLNTFNTFIGYEWKPNPSTSWRGKNWKPTWCQSNWSTARKFDLRRRRIGNGHIWMPTECDRNCLPLIRFADRGHGQCRSGGIVCDFPDHFQCVIERISGHQCWVIAPSNRRFKTT